MKINEGIKYCTDHKLWDQLNEIYNAVPSGTCQGCTNCCHESVNISMVEALHIVHRYYEMENGQIEIPDPIEKNLLKYYFSEWVMPRKCPFLNEAHLCSIYEARPLPCRIFGNRFRDAFDQNLKRIQRQNKRVAKTLFTELQLKLPQSVVNRTIEYCENYQRARVLDEVEVNELYDLLINLDGKLFFSGFMGEMMMNQHLVGFFIEYVLLDKAYEVVTSEFLQEIRLDLVRSLPMNHSNEPA
ncbi:YkgJ family cysteine cluster protein [Fusibacter ferrireducens]|uniref:YkgJ family cysteine cluster protein n=1 Tax=Fusibacter ferrireducens TaxID=2785058 RepID=A0ABR9ZT01_9FIRM|nr:YkgJ family cysteine cluster protein [Fusibacter ferrireducens]MBF4693584.1 YkgJ family cysteine cluster protein [Fusibacter ferrireducens]